MNFLLGIIISCSSSSHEMYTSIHLRRKSANSVKLQPVINYTNRNKHIEGGRRNDCVRILHTRISECIFNFSFRDLYYFPAIFGHFGHQIKLKSFPKINWNLKLERCWSLLQSGSLHQNALLHSYMQRNDKRDHTFSHLLLYVLQFDDMTTSYLQSENRCSICSIDDLHCVVRTTKITCKWPINFLPSEFNVWITGHGTHS